MKKSAAARETRSFPVKFWAAILAICLLVGVLIRVTSDKAEDGEKKVRKSPSRIDLPGPARKPEARIFSASRTAASGEEVAAPSDESLLDEVTELIAREGPAGAADTVRERYRARPALQRRAVELATQRWAEMSPQESWRWIADHLVENDSASSEDEKTELWRSAVSGYIGGAVTSDPEGAAGAAELLEVPGRPEGDSPGDAVSGNDEVPRTFAGDPGRPADPDFLTPERHQAK